MAGPFSSVFLTAQWRDLAMINFEVNPAVLKPLVPRGTELDDWHGQTLVSLVAFLFLNTRVLGVAVPLHRDFEEVNLRFYVRRKTHEGWRRGVVFVKEIVPRRAIAWVARVFFGEPYVALPMDHLVESPPGDNEATRRVAYTWRSKSDDFRLRMTVHGQSRPTEPNSEEAFITEHYWGYTGRRDKATLEYRVEHPLWRTWAATQATLDGDVAGLYGDRFAESLRSKPVSAFLADGSEVSVSRPVRLDGEVKR